ncbi:MAG: SDR family NAD(P)-dependent oxidoreductase [Kiritimatiellia bacterium]|nr:SDR family oxidoreductase [Lentisphaerota bacterium]
MELSGKKALVTGGARRIGRAISLALAQAGCEVVVHYHRSGASAINLAAKLRRENSTALALGADLRRPEECRRLVDQAWRALGGLDILINNAAVFEKHDLQRTGARILYATMAVNLTAPVLLTRYFAKRAKKGKIVNLLDQRIGACRSDGVAYVLSKRALADFTTMAAFDLSPEITVNAIAPGPVLPPTSAAHREPAGAIPLQHRPAPEDIVRTLLFLLHSDAITGQVIFVDGGQHLLG